MELGLNYVRGKVSLKKKRYQKNGYDLDLTCKQAFSSRILIDYLTNIQHVQPFNLWPQKKNKSPFRLPLKA